VSLSSLFLVLWYYLLFIIYKICIHDLFAPELPMIFSFHVGLTDSVMQWMQLFFSVIQAYYGDHWLFTNIERKATLDIKIF
jgi:hypothetical protein